MILGQGLKPTPPVSNTERQRRFRKRNPGYYGRLHRKRKARDEKYAALHAWRKAHLEVPLMLPSPEQVSTARADEFMREILEAVARRNEAQEALAIPVKVGERNAAGLFSLRSL